MSNCASTPISAGVHGEPSVCRTPLIFSEDGRLCSCTTDDDESVFPAEHLIPDRTWQTYAVYESPDSNYYDTERIYTLRTNTGYNLSDLFPSAYDMKLQSGNYHVTLTKEDNADGSKMVTVTADNNTTMVLLLLDKNGYVTDSKQIVFSSTGTEGSTDGLPVFEGETGKQYLRIFDPLNHNTPVPYGSAKVYTDEAHTQLYKEVTADKDGVVDISDWPVGTYYYTTEP